MFENLEDMLRMKVSSTLTEQYGAIGKFTPDFRVAVQEVNDEGVRVIIHASGYDSDTFDLLIKSNSIEVINHCK